MNLMIVPGILVCISFLISVCMFIVSKDLLISSATVIVRAWGAILVEPLCYGVVYFVLSSIPIPILQHIVNLYLTTGDFQILVNLLL